MSAIRALDDRPKPANRAAALWQGLVGSRPYALPRIGRIRRDRLAQDLATARERAGPCPTPSLDIDTIARRLHGTHVVWSDLLAAEFAILHLLTGARLRRRALDLHVRLQGFLGRAAYEAASHGVMLDRLRPAALHADTVMPTPTDDEVRAEAEAAAARLYDIFGDLHEHDERRSLLTLGAAVLIGALMLLMLALSLWTYYGTAVRDDAFRPARMALMSPSPGASQERGPVDRHGDADPGATRAGASAVGTAGRSVGPDAAVVSGERAAHAAAGDRVPMILGILVAGAVGGFVSFQRRVQAVGTATSTAQGADDTPSFMALLGLGHVITPAVLALVSGALFAVIINLLFATSWLSGVLFPRILTVHGSTGTTLMGWYLNTLVPGDDVPKLLLWSFVAGFAERLVPDLLDAIAARAAPASALPGA